MRFVTNERRMYNMRLDFTAQSRVARLEFDHLASRHSDLVSVGRSGYYHGKTKICIPYLCCDPMFSFAQDLSESRASNWPDLGPKSSWQFPFQELRPPRSPTY